MISNPLIVDTKREVQGPTPEFFNDPLCSLLTFKEGYLEKSTLSFFDTSSYELVKFAFDDAMSKNLSASDPVALLNGLKNFQKLAYELPALASTTNLGNKQKTEFMDMLTKVLKKIDEYKGILEKKFPAEHSIQKETMKSFQQVEEYQGVLWLLSEQNTFKSGQWVYDGELIKQLALVSEQLADKFNRDFQFDKAERYFKDAYFLMMIFDQNLGFVDGNVKQHLERIKELYNKARVSLTNQPKKDPKFQGYIDSVNSEYKFIDNATNFVLKPFDEELAMFYNNLRISFDQDTFSDSQFQELGKIYNGKCQSQRMPLTNMQKIDPSVLRPTIMAKQLKCKSALLASLISIIHKNKDGLKDVVYPRDPETRAPVYNPNGKYYLRLYLNGRYQGIEIDDYVHSSSISNNSTITFFNNGLDFYFGLINKAFQKLKHLGYEIDKDPAIYNRILMGPDWIPDRVLFVPQHELIDQHWSVIEKATSRGNLIVRKKLKKQVIHESRVFYNVLSAFQMGKHRVLLMQNVSKVDGDTIPDDMKIQLLDIDNDQQVYEHLQQTFKDNCQEFNGVFLTSYKRFLLNFDYGYINWRADMPVEISSFQQQKFTLPSMFPNIYAIHKKESIAVTTNDFFVPINGNPQYNIKINEKFQETSLWILLEWHSNQPSYERQLTFNVLPKKSSKVGSTGSLNSTIQSNFNKQIGQRYILSKIHISRQFDGNEFALVLLNHTNQPLTQMVSQDIAYSLYFYSVNKLEISDLPNTLQHTKFIDGVSYQEICSDPATIGYLNAPQFCIKPLIQDVSQKIHFVYCLNSKNSEHPLTFKLYDSGDLEGPQKCYDREPFAQALDQFSKFDFYEEQELIVAPPNFTKINLQALPKNFKAPPNTAFQLIVKSNVNFELSFLASDEENFKAHELNGMWNQTNAGGRPDQQYMMNPKYMVQFSSNTYARIGIECLNNPDLRINTTMFQSPFLFTENPNFKIFSPNKVVLTSCLNYDTKNIDYSNELWRQRSALKSIQAGTYIIIPSVDTAGVQGNFRMKLFTAKNVKVDHKVFGAAL